MDHIYFVATRNAVKIGISHDPRRRLSHATLAPERLSGEWFRRSAIEALVRVARSFEAEQRPLDEQDCLVLGLAAAIRLHPSEFVGRV